jgi:phenylacetate-CoA ligase
MNSRIAFIVYRTIQHLRGERVFEALKRLEQSQWESAEAIKHRQWQRLRELVRHAYDHVPYYRSLYDQVGFRPELLREVQDLERIPIIGKDVMRENSRNLIAQDRKYKFSEDTTSGSSGPTTIIYTDRKALAYQHAAVLRTYRWMGLGIGERLVRFWGTQLDTKRKTKDSIKDFLLNRRTFSTHALAQESLAKYHSELVRTHPAAIYGFTSAIYEFARFIADNDLRLDPITLKGILVTGEPLFGHQRELMEAVFRCRVYNEYGCAEFGPVAYECPEGELHIMAENVHVEIERADGESADGRGNLVMTELNNSGMPIIRYRMGDVGILSEGACSCGRGLPVLKEISGRLLDSVRTPDGKRVHGMYFEYLPKYFIGEIRQFQIVQEDLQHIKVRVVRDPQFNESTLLRFEGEIRKVIGRSVAVEFVVEAEIPREATGKNRLVVSRIGSDV